MAYVCQEGSGRADIRIGDNQEKRRFRIILTLRALMSTTVDILRFYWHLHNELLKVKCAFNFENTNIRWDFNFINNTNFQSCLATAIHNFK